MDVPNIITHSAHGQPVFFDILVEHDPPGTQPGERAASTFRVQCWVKRIAASDPEEAGRKAERFLVETRGVRNCRMKRWRYFNSRRQQEGGQVGGTLL